MSNIISLDIVTPDTEEDVRALADLKAHHEYVREHHPESEMVAITGNAVKAKQSHIQEHVARLKATHTAVQCGKIVGWQLVQVTLFENRECDSIFQHIDVGDIVDSYDALKAHLAAFLRKHFPGCYTHEGLESSAAYYSGELEDYGRFYMVNDYTDLGHDWRIPLIRFRLVDKENYHEVYVHPVRQ